MPDKKLTQLPSATTPLSGNEIYYAVQNNKDVKVVGSQLSSTGGSISLTRSQIPSAIITSNTIMVSGFSASGDLGIGAIYSSNGANANSTMAIQDAAGTWFGLQPTTYFDVGWFGATGNGSTDETGAFNAAYAACASSGYVLLIPPGTFRVNSLIWDQAVHVRGSGAGKTIFKPTGNNQTIIRVNGVTPDDRSVIIDIGGFEIINTVNSNIIGIHLHLCINYHFGIMSSKGPDTSILCEGCQFCVFDQLIGEQATTGVRVVDDLAGAAGGGNNNQFNSVDCYNNVVGLVVGRTGMPFGMGNNLFLNLVCQSNSLTGAYFNDQGGTVVTNFHPETNCTGVPNSMVIDGETITKAPLQSIGSSLFLPGFQNNDTPPVLAQVGSDLRFMITGQAKAAVTADSTSTVVYEGRAGNSSVLSNTLLSLSDDGTGVRSMCLDTQAYLFVDQAFPNLVTFNPAYPTISASNAASSGFDTDVNLGIVTTVTYNASAGGLATNRIVIPTNDTSYPIGANIFLSLLVKSSTTSGYEFNCAQSVIDCDFTLTAGVWTRLFMKNLNNTGLTRNGQVVIWPTDSAGGTLQMCRFISCINLTSLQIRLLSEQHRFNPRDKQGPRSLLAALPAFGTWAQNDIVWNNNATSGGFIGWVCTVAGSPGTWKTWGAIS